MNYWTRTGKHGEWVLVKDGWEQISIHPLTQDALRRRFSNLRVFNRQDPRQFRYY